MKTVRVRIGSAEQVLEVLTWKRPKDQEPGLLKVRLDGRELTAAYRLAGPGLVSLLRDGRTETVRLAAAGDGCFASAGGCHLFLERSQQTGGAVAPAPEQTGEVSSPIPAVVVRVLVKVGDLVEPKQALLVVAAMKLETTLTAQRAGVVTSVRAKEGDRVSPGDVLVVVGDAA